MNLLLILAFAAVVQSPPLPPGFTSGAVVPAQAPMLVWTPPTNTLTDYMLFQGATSGSYTNVYRLPADATNFVLLALTNGVMQFYRLTAFSTNGGASSNELMVNGPNTNTITVWIFLDASTNLSSWKSEWDLPIKFYLSNQPPGKVFRPRAQIGWNAP